ncbi:hypothetical protein ACFQZ4_40090 [Catellatospora coxensis]
MGVLFPTVAAALELYLDPVATARLRTLWNALEAEGVPTLRDLTHRKHRPHLSITSADVLDGPAVEAALRGWRSHRRSSSRSTTSGSSWAGCSGSARCRPWSCSPTTRRCTGG